MTLVQPKSKFHSTITPPNRLGQHFITWDCNLVRTVKEFKGIFIIDQFGMSHGTKETIQI